MGLISLTLPNDGETIDAADVNSPLNTIATAINGNLDNANIKTAAAIDGSKIADNSIPNTKMINAPLGWTAFANTPNTVTYNGNRNYDLVFNSTDLTSSLSPGMKLQLTRTVAAPDQCADLESGSSQYFSKTSPAGMTFTDDFVVSAWIKLESYTLGYIASRYNGTSGWALRQDASGQITLVGYNAGAANFRYVTSYASIPLNKWVHVTAQLDMSAHTATTTTSYVMFDGVDVAAFVGQGGTNPTALIQAGNLEIGSTNGGTGPFDGKLAQVAIFNAKVTQANMRTYMSQGLSGSETSLISAYSFDNAITDLNTTNANNLTANGGAAATATDSPFANAVAAGLLEYAEINSVAFSTNTTVNVRVPDTCMIPTSGGVSAVSYSTQSNPYGLPYFSRVLGRTIIMNTLSSSGTSDYEYPGFSTTVYIPTGGRVKVTLFGTIQNGGVANAEIKIWEGTFGSGNPIAHTLNSSGGAGTLEENTTVGFSNTAGSVTFRAGSKISASTIGYNCDSTAGVARQAYISVELV